MTAKAKTVVKNLTKTQKLAICQAKATRSGALLWLDDAHASTIAALYAHGIASNSQRPAFLTSFGLSIRELL